MDINNSTAAVKDPPMLERLKKIGRSGLFLALAILVTVSSVIGIISDFIPQRSAPLVTLSKEDADKVAERVNEWVEYFGEIGGFETDDIKIAVIENGGEEREEEESLFSTLVGSVFSLLFVAGVWIIFVQCRKTGGNFYTGGFTIIKVLQMIGLVIVDICGVIVSVSAVLLAAGAEELFEEYPDTPAGKELILAFIVGIAAVAAVFTVFAIIYTVVFKKALVSARETAKTGVPCDGTTKLFAVMLYIVGGVTVLSALGSTVLSGIGNLCSGAAYIIGGVLVFRFKKDHDEVASPAFYDAPAPEFTPPAPENPAPAPENPAPATEQPAPDEKRVCVGCGTEYPATMDECPTCGRKK